MKNIGIFVYDKIPKVHYIPLILFQSFACDKYMTEFRSIKMCSGGTKYKCSDCTKFFVSIESLIQHTIKYHMVRKLSFSNCIFFFLN